jgi:hypothetical protein
MGKRLLRVSCLSILVCSFLQSGSGQQVAPRPLIVQPIDEAQLTTLKGNTHPLARPQFDIGAAPLNLPLNRMLLVLKRSPEQEFALYKLLDDQQDRASSSYHKWLTPDEYGAQFGPSDQDLQLVTGWLQTHGFQVGRATHGRTVVEFSGTEAQVEYAFHTQIHKYVVNGEDHWANATDPQIPAALAPAVAGVLSLHNFPRKPMSRILGTYSPKTRQLNPVNPQFTLNFNCYPNGVCYAVGPADFGKIYNVQPLWNAGIDGTGQKIAIVGESDINIQDVRDFRSIFGLPANDPNIIYDGPNPGPMPDESEADIDVEWSGAIAPNATIDFVVSQSTETTFGVDLAALYIIDHNLAPVMSESYGECELGLGTAGNQFYNALWSQAAAQGITAILASGDSGSALCDFQGAPAQFGLAVSGFASTPFNVAIGGTDFNDFLRETTYWNTSNSSPTKLSAKGYIPETTWDLSCTNNPLLTAFGFSTNAENNCNDPPIINSGLLLTVGGSGGASNCTSNNGSSLSSCSGGYSKPSWQVAPGVPADGKRDIPDVSLFASNGVLNSFYIYCQNDSLAFCASGNYGAAGGTSFGAPAFAGIMALINQKMQTPQGQGNPNYILYKLAGQQSSSSCNSTTGPASTCVFNDVTVGTIAMPCVAGSRDCVVKTSGHRYGVLSGYATGTGFDLATGLGSLNVANLANKWSSVTFRPTNTSLSLNPTTNLTHGQSVSITASVTPSSGSGTPTGSVSLLTSTGVSAGPFTLANGALSGATKLLPGGSYTVSAHYAGDSTFGGSDSTPVNITIGKENSSPSIELVTFDWQGRFISGNASSAVYGSPYLLRVDVLNSTGNACQVNGVLQFGCPTGNVTLTDNGNPLDGGTFALNSLGYTEDQIVQFPGGSNSVKAQYAGDSSFNANSATTTYNITPAPTSISRPSVSAAPVGTPFSASATIQSQSFGAGPTGTVTFLANGSPVSGTVSYQSIPGSLLNPTAYLVANFSSSSSGFSAAGNYSITASYAGDGNYSGSTSAATSVSVQYPTPGLSLNPTSFNVAAGSSVTLTATVDTSHKNVPVPGGTVTFIDWLTGVPLGGNVNYSSGTDSSGNIVMQASLSFVPPSNMTIGASYGGDTNYPATSWVLANVTVVGSDFALFVSSPSITLSRGAQGVENVFVEGQSAYSGTITFSSSSCSNLPSEASCSFAPASVSGIGGTQLTITTTSPHSLAVQQASGFAHGLGLLALAPFAAILWIGFPRKRRWWAMGGACLLGTLLVTGLGCGGGSSGSGGSTDPGTPKGSYTVTLSGTSGSGSSAITHSTTFTLVVQ